MSGLAKHGVYPAAGGRFTPATKMAGRPEELDFIPPEDEARRTGINYDIKYRMGKELTDGIPEEEE